MSSVLIALLPFFLVEKPTVSLEESCRQAAAVVVVEAADARKYRILEVLHDETGKAIKIADIIAVDLRGMVYDKGRAYILFLKRPVEAKPYEAAPQMRTEDNEEMRARVRKILATMKTG